MRSSTVSRERRQVSSVADLYLHLCEGVVSLEVAHVIDAQLQVGVVTLEVMRIVVGLVVG